MVPHWFGVGHGGYAGLFITIQRGSLMTQGIKNRPSMVQVDLKTEPPAAREFFA